MLSTGSAVGAWLAAYAEPGHQSGSRAYAAAESGRNALGIRFTSVLPQLTPETDRARPE